MASKGINIKIYRTKLLTALKDKLSEVHSNQALYEAAVKTHEDNWKDYLLQLTKDYVKYNDNINILDRNDVLLAHNLHVPGEKYNDPEFIITIAEYQFQSVTAPDKEINFMGCIAKLTTI